MSSECAALRQNVLAGTQSRRPATPLADIAERPVTRSSRLVVLAGQPGGQPVDRDVEVGMLVDEGLKLGSQPAQRHVLLPSSFVKLLDAPVSEVHHAPPHVLTN